MTGGGAPGAAGIHHCLSQEKNWEIITADANDQVIGRYISSEFYQLPKADDPSFIPFLLDLCREKKIDVILPLVTRELPYLAANRNLFMEAGIAVPVSSQPSIDIANNKSRLYQFLEWRGIDLPAYKVVETVDQFIEALDALGYPQTAVCFKPSVSNGSRGFRKISDAENEADLLFNYKPALTFIRKDDVLRILRSAVFPELLVTEYLPGPEFSVDCICKQGEPVLVIPRSRKKMINGISVEGEFINYQSIISYCNRIIRELQLHGNIGIQVKQHADGRFLLLEINPRVQGTISAALGAGVNLPVLAIKQELGIPVSAADLEVKWGTRFYRHWNEVFVP